MSRLLVALLVCLPCLALSATYQCRFNTPSGLKILGPGESSTFEESCASHTCTCDYARPNMCLSKMIGCMASGSSVCYKPGEPATVARPGASPLKCVCQREADGSFMFVDCRSETCTDSRTGEQKASGESVTTVHKGVTYVCTCAGVDGYKNCRTEEAIKNEGKCLDQATGTYVPSGAPATTKQGDTVLHCVCSGTNAYSMCRRSTCPDVDGSVKKPGEKVTVKHGTNLLVCDCAGLEGYKNCLTKADFDNAGKCKDIEGNYKDKGQRYRVNYGGVNYECTCDGDNRGKECVGV